MASLARSSLDSAVELALAGPARSGPTLDRAFPLRTAEFVLQILGNVPKKTL